MKKLLLVVLVMVMASATAFSQDIYFGIGGAAGTKSGINDQLEAKVNFGAHARAFIDFSENLGFVGGLTYFMPTKVTILSNEVKMNYMQLNADVLYYLQNDEDVQVYGIGGMNYGMAKVTTAGIEATANAFNWEAGAGAKMGKVFIEAKYDSGEKQIIALIGIYF